MGFSSCDHWGTGITAIQMIWIVIIVVCGGIVSTGLIYWLGERNHQHLQEIKKDISELGDKFKEHASVTEFQQATQMNRIQTWMLMVEGWWNANIKAKKP